ncbi:MAG TPA: hypothetical protein VEC36_11800 [Patescibacteria group bacterium]|nr:hypothetical protein [Patescibacteria group bacterium]
MAAFKRILGIMLMTVGFAGALMALAMLFDPEIEDPAGTSIFTFAFSSLFLIPGFLLFKNSRNKAQLSKTERMEKTFYAVLHSNSLAAISDYDFAVQNKVSRQEAREFLEKKALELGASADANDRGMVVYHFGG